MTVDELIEKLAAYPGDHEVVMYNEWPDADGEHSSEINEVVPGNYNPNMWDGFTPNGKGKLVDVNAVALWSY